MIPKTSVPKESSRLAAHPKPKKAATSHWSFESVRYVPLQKSVELFVTPHFKFSISVAMIAELAQASDDVLAKMYLTPSGETLVIEGADAYISLPGLFRDLAKDVDGKKHERRFLSRKNPQISVGSPPKGQGGCQ
jgi:hypothetical protein